MSERAELLSRHESPDREFTWVVYRQDDEISFGFEGGDWHLHPEQFEAGGRSPEQIAAEITGDLLDDRLVIVTEVHPDGLTENGLLDSIEDELELAGTYADLRFRFWSGRRVYRAELLERTVTYKPLTLG